MKNGDRVDLIRKIKLNKDNINDSTIESLAINYQIPSSVSNVPPLVHNLVVQPQKRQPEQISGLPGIVYNELTSEDVLAFPPQSAIGLAGDVYELIPDDAQAIIKEIIGRMVLIDPYDANTHQPFVTIPIS